MANRHYIQSLEEFYQLLELGVPVHDLWVDDPWTANNFFIREEPDARDRVIRGWIKSKDLYVETE